MACFLLALFGGNCISHFFPFIPGSLLPPWHCAGSQGLFREGAGGWSSVLPCREVAVPRPPHADRSLYCRLFLSPAHAWPWDISIGPQSVGLPLLAHLRVLPPGLMGPLLCRPLPHPLSWLLSWFFPIALISNPPCLILGLL